MPAISGYAESIRLVLKEIDRHPDCYHSRKSQHDMLSRVIREHDLKTHDGRKSLSVEALDSRFSKFAGQGTLPKSVVQRRRQRRFLKGSSAISRKELDSIGFPSTANQETTEDDDDQTPLAESSPAKGIEIATHDAFDISSSASGEGDSEYMEPSSPFEAPEHMDIRERPILGPPMGEEGDHFGSNRPDKPRDSKHNQFEWRGPLKRPTRFRIPQLPAHSPSSPAEEHKSPRVPTPSYRQPVGKPPLNKRKEMSTGPAENTIESTSGRLHKRIARDTISAPAESADAASVSSSIALHLVKLADDEVRSGIQTIWTFVRSYTCTLLEAHAIDGEHAAELVIRPSPELVSLYRRLFGKQWPKNAINIVESRNVNARHLIEACIAAALYDFVWDAIIPWRGMITFLEFQALANLSLSALAGPRESMEVYSQDEKYMDEVLHEMNRHSLSLSKHSLRFVVWQFARNKLLNDDFQRDTTLPVAETLGKNLRMVIGPQLSAVGGSNVNVNGADAETLGHTEELVSIFSEALTLKGQLDAAPDYYKLSWPTIGSKVSDGSMESVHATKDHQEVRFAVMPEVQKRTNEQADWLTVCKAKVFSKPVMLLTQ